MQERHGRENRPCWSESLVNAAGRLECKGVFLNVTRRLECKSGMWLLGNCSCLDLAVSGDLENAILYVTGRLECKSAMDAKTVHVGRVRS